MRKITQFFSDYGIKILTAAFLFGFFYYISNRSPLAGDDWAFHNNAVRSTLINAALGMYNGWEARLSTLFSIHFLILHKNLWEILNPMGYVIIYLMMMFLIKPKKKLLLSVVFIFILISVKDNVRMEVFSWITGSIYYGIPLVLSVVYAILNYEVYSRNRRNVPWFWMVISALCALYIPLGMENIGIAIMLSTIFLMVISYYRNRKIPMIYWINLIALIISYGIWIASPGSAIRLAQMPEWNQLNFFEKIFKTMPNVLFFTFYQNKYLIALMGLTMFLYNFKKFKSSYIWIMQVVYIISLVVVFSLRLANFFPENPIVIQLSDGNSIFNIAFWIIYAIVLTVQVVLISVTEQDGYRITFFFLIALFSSAALLMSPVIGYRLMIYTIVYLGIVILLTLEKTEIKLPLQGIIIFVLIGFMVLNVKTLVQKYNQVASITQEREDILADYHQYSEFYKDGIWLPRYPIFTIHAGDIEFEDTYHMKAFKIYNNIPEKMEVIFYWKESY